MENAPYLLAGFIIVWAVIFIFVISLTNRQRRIQRDLEILKGAVKEKEPV